MRKSTDPDLRISAARSYALVRRGRFCPQKKRMTVLQLDLRRNATRCTAYYTGSSTDLQAVLSAEGAGAARHACRAACPPRAAVPKTVFRTVDGSGTLCLWENSLLQKGRSGRVRYLPIFRMYWSAFRQSSAHRPDAPHCPSVRYCAAPRGATACARQAAGRRFAVQTIYYNV